MWKQESNSDSSAYCFAVAVTTALNVVSLFCIFKLAGYF